MAVLGFFRIERKKIKDVALGKCFHSSDLCDTVL